MTTLTDRTVRIDTQASSPYSAALFVGGNVTTVNGEPLRELLVGIDAGAMSEQYLPENDAPPEERAAGRRIARAAAET